MTASDLGSAPLTASGRHRTTDAAIRLLLIVAQLGVLVLLVYTFKLESRSFFRVLLLACAGFIAGFALPANARMPFFAGLSILSVITALGLSAASAVLAIGIVFILLCHVPVALKWRLLLIGCLSAGLAVLRTRVALPDWPPMVLPIVASMFMFRLALYLHALRYDTVAANPADALAYFFMMPNACFPLFPVVDFKTFVQSGTHNDRWTTYEAGLRALFRGVVQLLLYRVVKHEFAISDSQVFSLGDLIQHLLSMYLLYLRVSGQFHVIVGLVHLFGYRLPETHFRYFLASSFSDLWRRINIYWKDFMLKLVFYPSYFRVRHQGTRAALVLSTLAVFLTTWFLHSYQQFWLQGKPLLDGRDAIFWAVFAGLVVVSSLRQGTDTGRAPVARNAWSVRRAVSVITTLCVVALLWSFWTAQSFDTWRFMFTQARFVGPYDVFMIVALLCAGLLVTASPWAAQPISARSLAPVSLGRSTRYALTRIAGSLILCAIVLPDVSGRLAPFATRITRTLRDRGVPYQALGAYQAGYYDQVQKAPTDVPGDAWYPAERQNTWDGAVFGYRERNDFLMDGSPPLFTNMVAGSRISINRWGMRDRDYQQEKASDTYRIAFIGNSIGMGWGVGDSETFEALIEPVLDSVARAHGRRIEVLNLSGLGPTMAKEVFSMSVWARQFSPDLVVLTSNTNEVDHMANAIRRASARNIPIPDSALAAIAAVSLATSDTTLRALALRLRLVEEDWHRRVLAWAKESADSLHTRLAILQLRAPGERKLSPSSPLARALRESEIPILSCSDAYAGIDPGTLWVSPADQHPTAKGHVLLARCLLRELRAHPALLPVRLDHEIRIPSPLTDTVVTHP